MNNMKKLTLTSLVLAMSIGTASAANNCEGKKAEVENQIKLAEQHGNKHKVAGLKLALADITTYCSDDKLLADAEQKVAKLQEKITEKQDDIKDVQEDLNEAKAESNSKKVAKYEQKLAKEQLKLTELEKELQFERSELDSLKK